MPGLGTIGLVNKKLNVPVVGLHACRGYATHPGHEQTSSRHLFHNHLQHRLVYDADIAHQSLLLAPCTASFWHPVVAMQGLSATKNTTLTLFKVLAEN